MKFNYNREKRKFDTHWKRLQADYEAAGMDLQSIEEMRKYDWAYFCALRNHRRHTQALPQLGQYKETALVALVRKFPSLAVPFDEQIVSDRYGWIETVENDLLRTRLFELEVKDLELLTLLIIDGYKKSEIARIFGVSCSAITQRIQKIKIMLRKI